VRTESKYKKGWILSGAGGHDTLCCKHEGNLSFVGLKQIWHHGLFNLSWWVQWFYYKLEIEGEK